MKRTRRRLSEAERLEAKRFHESIRGQQCQYPGCLNVATDAHHVIEAQHLRRNHLPVYDVRNALPLCHSHHMNVTVRAQHIPRKCLWPENEEFARAHGQEWYLERFYK